MEFCHLLTIDHLSPNQPFINKILTKELYKNFELLLNEEVQAAINHVLIALKGYYKSDNPIMPFHDLKYWAFSIDGAAILKKIRKQSYVKSIRGSFYTDPEWLNTLPIYDIKEIGDIFNYQYCFPWNVTDEQDYLIAFSPLQFGEGSLDLFRQKAREMLHECSEIDPLDEREIFLNLSSSVAQDNGKTNFHYLCKHNHLKFSERRTSGKRTLITTSPGDGRDAIINEVEDLNTIQYIEYQLDKVLQNTYLREYLVNRNEEEFRKKYELFIDNNRYFLMRDIKKEGLTKPKVLLKIMLEELYRRYPNCKAFSYTSFYDGPWFEGDTTGRGHGLGMANNLTTLMQIILFKMLIEITSEAGLDIKYDMICHNDDIIIGVNCEEDLLDDAINFDCQVLEDSGIIISKDKSFHSPYGGVICERYIDKYDRWHKKQSYIEREKLLLYTCCNVVHLKSMLSSFYSKFSDDINIGELAAYFGYEFHPCEFDMPISIGGWQRSKSLRCSFDLKWISEHLTKRISRIYIASRLNKTHIKYSRRIEQFVPPVLRMYNSKIWDTVDPKILESFNIVSDFSAKNQFTRLRKSPKRRLEAWTILLEKRREAFNGPSVSFEIIYDLEYSDLKNIFPLEQDIDRWVDIQIINRALKDPYNVPNPICSALNKIFDLKDERYNSCYWPLLAKSHDNILRAGARKDLARIITYVPPIYLYEEEDTVIPRDSQDFEDFMLSYPAPLLMGKVFEIYGKIPILKKKLVKDTWNFKMTEQRFFLFNHVQATHLPFLVEIMERLDFTSEEMLEIYERCLPSYKPTRRDPEILDPEEIDDDEMAKLCAELKASFAPKYLSWEDSWEAVSNIEPKNAVSFDSILFDLDPQMREIVFEAKAIYSQLALDEMLLFADSKGEAQELIKKFNEDYPDFMELFGFELPKANDIENSDDDEGQFGDFNPDDFI